MKDNPDSKPNYAHRCNEAGRLIIRWGRAHLDLTGEDIDRGAHAVRNDPYYRYEVLNAALRYADYAHHDPDLRKRLIDAGRLLDDQPLPHGKRCNYGFPLPGWAGEDQMDPCRCDLHYGHEGEHECEHMRSRSATDV